MWEIAPSKIIYWLYFAVAEVEVLFLSEHYRTTAIIEACFPTGDVEVTTVMFVFSGGEITWSTTCFFTYHLEYKLFFQVARPLGVQSGVAAAQLAHCRAHRPSSPSKPVPLQIIKVARMFSHFSKECPVNRVAAPDLHGSRTHLSCLIRILVF